MKRSLALLAALAMVAVFGSATLAGADCAYHKAQAAADKADAAKSVAEAPATDKQQTSEMKIVKVDQPVQTPAEGKN